MKKYVLLLASVLLLAAACAPAAPAPAASPTATLPLPASPTPVWFPPTNTPTPPPLPTATPTPAPYPGQRQLTLAQALDDKAAWSIPQSSLGSVTLQDGRMTFALHEPQYYLFSLRAQPQVDDFYAEVRVKLSLCRGTDAYGILFRTQSAQDYYRLTLNCQREIRLDRVRHGKLAYIQPPLLSPNVPPGPPAEVTLGVWAAGSEIRVFVDQYLQFRLIDPVFRSGGLGLFAKSGDTGDETIVFSQMRIWQIDYLSPTPAPTASITPRP